MTKKEKVQEIFGRLYLFWPTPKTELFHQTPFQLLVAVMLSAQTTDKLVNSITPALFTAFKTPEDFSMATEEEIYLLIRKVNYSHTKAKRIKATAKIIVDTFKCKIPSTMEELLTLPGVARKTANVVLSEVYGKSEGIVVDTHVMRLSKALGLTDKNIPEKIEKDLMEIVPKEKWRDFSHLLILFGRYKCPARMKVKDSPELGDLAI